MNKIASKIITTACVGAAVGTAAYMMSSGNHAMHSKARKIKKSTGRALRQVGDLIESVSYMMR